MIRKINLLIIFMFISQCGFKVLDTSINSFDIEDVETIGYNRVNFFIKNDLLSKNNKLSNNKVSMQIDTKRTKEISEKNIRNEITKYRVTLNTKIEIQFSEKSKYEILEISKNGDYRIGTTSLKTSRNLDNLEKRLSKEISRAIKQKLIFISNDL